jgi:hypothetical protein
MYILYRIAGNRTAYAVTDHGEYWLPLRTSWNGGGPVHEPRGAPWPWEVRNVWLDAVLDAAQLALMNEGDKAAVKWLPRAQVIAKRRNWRRIGDRFDAWRIPGLRRRGIVYIIKGTHPDSDTVTQ